MGQLCEEGVPGNCSEPESHKGKERRMRGHLDGSGLKRSEGEVGDASGRNCRRRGGRTGKMKMRANMQRYRETYMKM